MMTTHGVARHMIARCSLAFALVAALFASLFSLGTAQAQVPVDSVQPYNQHFDSLPTSGPQTWTDNVTLVGWYASRGTDAVSSIAVYDNATMSPVQGLYSFGSIGSAERALGAIGGSTGQEAFGILLKNTSSVPIEGFTIGYTGEQWFDGNTLTQSLDFEYKVGATIQITDTTGWIDNAETDQLQFDALHKTGSGPLNGNDPANRKVFAPVSVNVTPDLQPNQYVMFRWKVNPSNISGTDQGLAVDDLSIQAQIPSTVLPHADCPTLLETTQGTPNSAIVSATDPNGTVTSAAITSDPVAGISLTDQTPATSAGGVFTATLHVDETVPQGTYPVAIQFTSGSEATSCFVNVVVNPQVQNASFATSKKTVSSTSVNVGEVFTYTLTVTNSGNAAGSFTLTDQLPDTLDVVSTSPGLAVSQTSSGKALTASGTLSTGQQVVYTVGVKATVAGTVDNTATVTSDGVTTPLAAPRVTVSNEPVRYLVYLPLIVRGT